VLPREDVRDAFISLRYASLDQMPAGAIVGTSSLRRQAQVKRVRPDLEVVQFRGNVQTRLRKLSEGVADATLLACAGLNRLGLTDRITCALETEQMLPAVAQGAIAIEIRGDDEATAKLIQPLNHATTAICVTAERAFLTKLEGSCRTPIAGNAVLKDGRVQFRGMTFSPDGVHCFEIDAEAVPADAAEMGSAAASELIRQGASEIIVRHA
jgi:hydroxymethylbilane synthase